VTEGLLEEKSSKYSTRCRGNPKETRRKYAGPLASIVVLISVLKDRVYTQMSIDKIFRRFGISLSYVRRFLAKLGGNGFIPIFPSLAVTETFPILSNLSSHGPGKCVKLSQRCVERDFSWSNHATWLIIVKQGSCGRSCKTCKFSSIGKSWKRAAGSGKF